MDRLRSGVKIEVHMSTPQRSEKKLYKKVLTIDDISSIGFCCVSYPGDGKYNATPDLPERAILWDKV